MGPQLFAKPTLLLHILHRLKIELHTTQRTLTVDVAKLIHCDHESNSYVQQSSTAFLFSLKRTIKFFATEEYVRIIASCYYYFHLISSFRHGGFLHFVNNVRYACVEAGG